MSGFYVLLLTKFDGNDIIGESESKRTDVNGEQRRNSNEKWS